MCGGQECAARWCPEREMRVVLGERVVWVRVGSCAEPLRGAGSLLGGAAGVGLVPAWLQSLLSLLVGPVEGEHGFAFSLCLVFAKSPFICDTKWGANERSGSLINKQTNK